MATLQDLKRRVRSIRNTRKITRAMELVAAARLRRAQARIEAMRPYADRMLELMAGTARASTSLRGLPLLQRREVQTVAIVPITGDRGLAGAFNAQILRRSFALERRLRDEGTKVRWAVVVATGPTALALDRLLPGAASPTMTTDAALALMFAATLAVVTTSLAQDWRRVARLLRAAEERRAPS